MLLLRHAGSGKTGRTEGASRAGADAAGRGRVQKPKEYSFNPLQAEHEVKIGNFYFHKGKYRAAEQRFREATRWNPNLAEAYVRLGEAAEKEKDWSAAREAYEKFVELAADDKRSPEIRKKLAKLTKGKT